MQTFSEFFEEIGLECTLDILPPEIIPRMYPRFRFCRAYVFPIPLSLYNTDCVPLKIFHLNFTDKMSGPISG